MGNNYEAKFLPADKANLKVLVDGDWHYFKYIIPQVEKEHYLSIMKAKIAVNKLITEIASDSETKKSSARLQALTELVNKD